MSSAIRIAARNAGTPRARRKRRRFTVHGESFVDDFAYLRDADDPHTSSYIEKERAYFSACMEPVRNFEEVLFRELKARIVEDDVSVAEIVDGYSYYTRIKAGQQYPFHCRMRKNGAASREEVYLDENLLASGSEYCEVAVASICPGRKTVACAVDRTGDERYEILVASMKDGRFSRRVAEAGDSIAWSSDHRYLVYTTPDQNARPDSVWACDLNDGSHHCLYVEDDPAFYLSVWSSRSEKWLFMDSVSNTSSETRVLRADSVFEDSRIVIPRREEVEYTVEHHEDRFLVLTNDRSENFRLVSMPTSLLPGEPALEIIAPRDEVSLEFVDAYRHHLVIGERWNGVERVLIWDFEHDTRRYLPGSGPLAHVDVDDLYDYDSRYVRCEYSTPVEPPVVYDYDVATTEMEWRKTESVPGYQQERYDCVRREVPVEGVLVPLTLVAAKHTLQQRDGRTPVLLTGYGAYEEPADAEFDSDLISLLDRGVMVAMAHVRGGGDLGPAWHDDGRLSNKENSFKDFTACARYLIDQGITEPGRIAAWGASAGGLLAAVAAQRQPGLFSAVVLEVPFLDVLNTLLDPELPLTEYDFDEFGNPSRKEEFQWIRAYSPYDNICAQDYPPMLVSTAMNDQRVGYWEALKWTARVRHNKTDDKPLLLKIDSTGHLGESGRYDSVRHSAVIYTFLLDAWDLIPDRA